MERAALGIRMHSGWGVLVAVAVGKKVADADSLEGGLLEIIDRRRIVTVAAVQGEAVREPGGANQPYHHAANLPLAEAERYLARCAALSGRMALAVIAEVVRELDARQYRIVGAAVLLASGRPLPPLAKILAAHPLIHTAEGEFFRRVVRAACEGLKIPVTAIPERELLDRAKAAFGRAAGQVQRRIASLGSSIGPPWTKDHKAAALGAAMVLIR